MGSPNTSPQQPIDPQTARATGFRPSILSSWLTLARGQASGRVRFPAPLVRSSFLTLLFWLLPRDAAAPSPAMLVGPLMSASGAAVPSAAFALALASAVVLASSKHFYLGVSQ